MLRGISIRAISMNISVVILSGGRSVRMGQDKARLILNRKDFVSTLAGELSADQCQQPANQSLQSADYSQHAASQSLQRADYSQQSADQRPQLLQTSDCQPSERHESLSEHSAITQVMISAAHEDDYADLGLQVLSDEHQGIGPIEGIRQGLRFASEEYVFVCAVDMPFVQRKMALYLAGLITEEYQAYVYRAEGRVFPTCAIYHRSVLPVIESLIRQERYRLREILDSVHTRYVDMDENMFGRDALMNVNTPEEYHSVQVNKRQQTMFILQ